MEFLKGSKREFDDFINQININDNIAVITHTDLDGIVSAIFLEEILNSKNLKIKLLKFADYKNDIIKKLLPKLIKDNIKKIFILDLNIDSLALDDFNNLRKIIPTFLIDHHPIDPNLKDFSNIIKGESSNCAAQIINFLGNNFTEFLKTNWLLIPTMISEFSYKNKINMEFITSKHKNISSEDILNSYPGKLSILLNYSLIYYNDNLKIAFDLIRSDDREVLKKAYLIINKEINEQEENILKNSEYNKEKDLYFYYFKPKHRIKSMISTNLSLKKPNSTFVIATPEGKEKDFLNISSRNQSKRIDMNLLMKKGVQGLKNANGGGHPAAAGARLLKKDLKKFKENILK